MPHDEHIVDSDAHFKIDGKTRAVPMSPLVLSLSRMVEMLRRFLAIHGNTFYPRSMKQSKLLLRHLN